MEAKGYRSLGYSDPPLAAFCPRFSFDSSQASMRGQVPLIISFIQHIFLWRWIPSLGRLIVEIAAKEGKCNHGSTEFPAQTGLPVHCGLSATSPNAKTSRLQQQTQRDATPPAARKITKLSNLSHSFCKQPLIFRRNYSRPHKGLHSTFSPLVSCLFPLLGQEKNRNTTPDVSVLASESEWELVFGRCSAPLQNWSAGLPGTRLPLPAPRIVALLSLTTMDTIDATCQLLQAGPSSSCCSGSRPRRLMVLLSMALSGR